MLEFLIRESMKGACAWENLKSTCNHLSESISSSSLLDNDNASVVLALSRNYNTSDLFWSIKFIFCYEVLLFIMNTMCIMNTMWQSKIFPHENHDR